jgi:hypothetical protein
MGRHVPIEKDRIYEKQRNDQVQVGLKEKVPFLSQCFHEYGFMNQIQFRGVSVRFHFI